MKNFKKGFTLIELLVVIAIVGLLASIVLASLQQARDKGKNASLQGSMSSLRTQAEIHFANNSNSYAALFNPVGDGFVSSDPGVQTILTSIGNISTIHTAGSSDDAWAAQVRLLGTANYFCVDSTGAAKTGTSLLAAGGTVCP